MIVRKKLYILTISLILVWTGCGSIHLPTSEHPINIERVFHASFDDVWDSVLEVVNISNGNIITVDRPAGLIVYSIYDNELHDQAYNNVYIKSNANGDATTVYFCPHTRRSFYWWKILERDFFEKIENEF